GADAGADEKMIASDVHRRCEPVLDAAQKLLEVGPRGDARDKQRKLVTADAGKHAVLRHQEPQAPRGLADDIVSGRMAERVVDVLEMIKVDIGDAERPLARAPFV